MIRLSGSAPTLSNISRITSSQVCSVTNALFLTINRSSSRAEQPSTAWPSWTTSTTTECTGTTWPATTGSRSSAKRTTPSSNTCATPTRTSESELRTNSFQSLEFNKISYTSFTIQASCSRGTIYRLKNCFIIGVCSLSSNSTHGI